ncbi:MAG: BlaI/MecI/CopY family transcriptional regulator [Actinobacteria bacterium]|nr:MAG: BlaI/MecI/CopY family transcriptional regulator [Actinomycetota bacterium]
MIGIEGIGRLEADVLSIIWKHDKSLTVRDIYEEMRDSRKIAYTTVMTVLNNLTDKGILKQDKTATAYVYSPKVSNEELAQNLCQVIVDKLLFGKAAPLTSYFAGKR